MKLNICTYNIRTDVKADGINSFDGRTGLIAREFPKYGADVIGFQEAKPHQRAWLAENLTGYTVVGTGRDANYGGEHVCIAYKTAKFELMGLETFWLSDTPRVSGSRFHTDQSSCPRVCTVAILLTKPVEGEAAKILRVYNTHLDHVGKMAQAQGISLILQRIAADDMIYPDTPIVLTGDFNVLPESPVVASVTGMVSCGKPLVDATADVGVTFHGYHPENAKHKIDYIFTTAAFDASKSKTLTDEENGVFFSDHYPVLAEIEI